MTTDAPFTKDKFFRMLHDSVVDMRRLQKVFFSAKTQTNLNNAKDKEKQVDYLIEVARKFCYFEF